MQTVSNASRESLNGKKGKSSPGLKKSRSFQKKDDSHAVRTPLTGHMAHEIELKNTEIKKVHDEIASLIEKLKAPKERTRESDPESAELQKLKEERTNANANSKTLQEEVRRIQDMLEAEGGNIGKDELRPDDYDRKISELEAKVESAKFSVKEEKQLILEISRLRKSKVGALAKFKNYNEDNIKALKEKLFATKKQLKESRNVADEINRKFNEIKEVVDARKESAEKKRDENEKKRDVIKENIDSLRETVKSLKEEREKLFEVRKQKQQESYLMKNLNNDIMKIEREIIAVERKKKAQPSSPKLMEKDAAQTLVKYLRQKAGLEVETSSTMEKSLSNLNIRKVNDSALSLPKGVKAATLVKKVEVVEDEYYASMSKKKAAKSSSASSKANPSSSLTLEFWAVAALGEIGVPVPLTFGDIEVTIKTIEAKQGEFEEKASALVEKQIKAAKELDDEISELNKRKEEKEAELEALKQSFKVEA